LSVSVTWKRRVGGRSWRGRSINEGRFTKRGGGCGYLDLRDIYNERSMYLHLSHQTRNCEIRSEIEQRNQTNKQQPQYEKNGTDSKLKLQEEPRAREREEEPERKRRKETVTGTRHDVTAWIRPRSSRERDSKSRGEDADNTPSRYLQKKTMSVTYLSKGSNLTFDHFLMCLRRWTVPLARSKR
jgi:hypothetical protein